MIQTKQGIKKSKRAQHLLFLRRLKGYTDITVSNSCDNSLRRVMLELMDNSPLHTEHWGRASQACLLPGSALVTLYSISQTNPSVLVWVLLRGVLPHLLFWFCQGRGMPVPASFTWFCLFQLLTQNGPSSPRGVVRCIEEGFSFPH